MSTPIELKNYPKEITGNDIRDLTLKTLAWIAIGITFLGMIPFNPGIGSGLESWTVVMNEAVAGHLAIGRDVVFTFGPFASVYTQLYHPAIYPIMLVGSAILAAGLCAGFALLSFERRPALLILLPLLVGIAWSRDAIFLAIPFLLMVVCFRATLPRDNAHHLEISGGKAVLLGIVACAVGILPLVKVSFLGLAIIEGFASVAMLVFARRFGLVVLVIAVAAASLLLGWVWSGQPLGGLVHYVLAQRSIVSGYSEAMAVDGPFSEVVYWFLAAAILTIAFYLFIARGRGLIGLIALAGIALYLLTSFKAGFVRQDLHQHTSSATLLFIALALAAMLDARKAIVISVVALAGWFAIEHSLVDYKPGFAVQRLRDSYNSAYVWLPRRVLGDDSLPTNYNNVKNIERTQNPLKDVSGTADVYPTRVDLLFMNDIRWSGRPVMQSYSAYRPVLDQLNADHLTGPTAPDNVFFAVTPIDGRLPSLEDALSWGVFLTNYSIVGQQHDLIQMKKSLPPRAAATRPLLDMDARTNEAIAIPPHDGVVIARINMRPTLLGQAVLAAYKLPQVYIELTLTTGETVRYRYIPEMGTTGFVLSPLVAANDDFVAMAAGRPGKTVKEIRLVSPNNLLWKQNVHIKLETLHVAPQADAEKLFAAAGK